MMTRKRTTRKSKEEVTRMIVDRTNDKDLKYTLRLTRRELQFILQSVDRVSEGEDSRLAEDLMTTLRGGITEEDGIQELTWAQKHPDRVGKGK